MAPRAGSAMSGRSRARAISATERGADRPLIATSSRGKASSPSPASASTSVGDDQLAALLLGQRLQPARGVDGRADHRHRRRPGMADLAHDQRAPRRSPCRCISGMPISLGDLAVEAVEPEVDVARRAQCLAAAGRLAVAAAEDRHQAVAQILVDGAVVALDGLAHLREQAVEDEHHVVGQPVLADLVKPRVSRNSTARLRSIPCGWPASRPPGADAPVAARRGGSP